MKPKRKSRKAGNQPKELELEKSLMFFHAYMFGPLQGKRRLYKARGIRLGNVITPSDWEAFASMLVDDLGSKGASGVDLSKYEVKSALDDGDYEYQYHKDTGKQKLKKDMQVGHLFFNHSDFLRRVELRYVEGADAKKDFFRTWLNAYPDPYPQRYRKHIPFNWVKEHGTVLVVLENGEVSAEKEPTSIP